MHAENVHIAVAANFSFTMKQLAAEYQQHSEDELLISYGSSGKLYAQIVRGAPFQIFLSADQQKPAALEEQDRVVPYSRFTYARGMLLLWSADSKRIPTTFSLLDLEFNKLALANPRSAPYGLAAQQVLQNLGIYQDVQPHLVQGENIAQAFTFVKTGNAQLGFIALAQYLQLDTNSRGSAWQVPDNLHQPITQDAVLLRNAGQSARQFFQFLKSPVATQIIANTGYQLHQQRSSLVAE